MRTKMIDMKAEIKCFNGLKKENQKNIDKLYEVYLEKKRVSLISLVSVNKPIIWRLKTGKNDSVTHFSKDK